MSDMPLLSIPSHAIAGIGTDLIYLHRIESAFTRFGERFVQRILGVEEQQKFHARYTRDHKRGLRFLATRFAAKEAFSKAIGLGMRMPMYWSAMQVLNDVNGRPIVMLADPLQTWYAERFGQAHVSLTDEVDIVMAFVIVEAHRLYMKQEK